MTNPRTLVKDSLTFCSPRRVPRDLWTLPWAEQRYPAELAEIRASFPADLATAPGFLRQQPRTQGNAYQLGTYVDEWGCAFENLHGGVIGEVKQPFLAHWSDLERLRPPDEMLSIDAQQINSFCRQTERFVIGGCCPRPFERMQFLRGSEALYFDLAEQPAELFTLIERVHSFYLRELELWCQTEVDAVMYMDDWGAQHALLISPRQWRKLFKPLYRDYIELAHRYGKFILMHSDGYTLDIIPDLIELGLDGFNTQLFTMDIEQLGQRFAGKLTFWGEMDRQHLLPFGTPQAVDAAVRRVHHALWSNGGVIAQCEFSAGGRPENVRQVYQTWQDLLPGSEK